MRDMISCLQHTCMHRKPLGGYRHHPPDEAAVERAALTTWRDGNVPEPKEGSRWATEVSCSLALMHCVLVCMNSCKADNISRMGCRSSPWAPCLSSQPVQRRNPWHLQLDDAEEVESILQQLVSRNRRSTALEPSSERSCIQAEKEELINYKNGLFIDYRSVDRIFSV